MTPSMIRAGAVLTGVMLVSIGAGMMYLPAGLIVVGLLLLTAGIIGHMRGGA